MRFTRKFSKFVEKKYPNWDISIALRYLPIVEKLKERSKKKTNILDVGSGEFGIATYLGGGFEVVGTDIDFGKKRSKGIRLVKASADNLPFKSDSFNTVLSVDMMEHLPKKLRQKSIDEMVRVSNNHLYIAFPRGEISSLIDRFIDRYYQLTHKERLEYLNEHVKYGLPEEKKIISMIEASAANRGKRVQIKTKGNTNSILWTFLLMMGFSQVKPITYVYHKLVLLLPILKHLNIWPTYRVIIYAKFN